MAKSPLLQAEFQAMLKRLAVPPGCRERKFELTSSPKGFPSSTKTVKLRRRGTTPRR